MEKDKANKQSLHKRKVKWSELTFFSRIDHREDRLQEPFQEEVSLTNCSLTIVASLFGRTYFFQRSHEITLSFYIKLVTTFVQKSWRYRWSVSLKCGSVMKDEVTGRVCRSRVSWQQRSEKIMRHRMSFTLLWLLLEKRILLSSDRNKRPFASQSQGLCVKRFCFWVRALILRAFLSLFGATSTVASRRASRRGRSVHPL